MNNIEHHKIIQQTYATEINNFQKFIDKSQFHGFLITGSNEIPKKEFILSCLQSLQPSIPYPQFCDIFEINQDHNLDDVRALLNRLHYTSDKKQCILISEKSLTKPITNVLLKSIEEPEAFTYFFILSSHPYMLADTLRSRLLPIYLNATKIKDFTFSYEKEKYTIALQFLFDLIKTSPNIIQTLSYNNDEIAFIFQYLSNIIYSMQLSNTQIIQKDFKQIPEEIDTFFNKQDPKKILSFWKFLEHAPLTWADPLYRDPKEDIIQASLWFLT